MKQVILNIPEGEFEFFMKLVKKFKYKTSETVDYSISEDVQQLVEDRREPAKTSDYITRSQSKDKIFELVKQLSMEQKKKLIKVLQKQSPINDDIPEQHKAFVRDRIKHSKANSLLDWDNVKNDFDGI